MDLREVAKVHKDKLDKIKVLAFDIDGVLTTGHIWWDGDVGFNRYSHTSDGYALKLMMKNGFKVGVISGGDSVGVKKRFEDNLGLDFCFFGNEDKRVAFQKVLDLGFRDEEVLYMGDEFFDTPLLKRAGFGVTVPIASYEVKKFCDYVTMRESGQGAVREVIDIMRYNRGITPDVLDFDGKAMDFSS